VYFLGTRQTSSLPSAELKTLEKKHSAYKVLKKTLGKTRGLPIVFFCTRQKNKKNSGKEREGKK